MGTKQCHECYKELDMDTIFCSRCGTKLIIESGAVELNLNDVYKAVLRLEDQVKEQMNNKSIPTAYIPNQINGFGMQPMVVKKKKKSGLSLSSIIITILIVLIMISLSFIGTVFVNVHASGYTKTSGQVVNEILEMIKGDEVVPLEREAIE